MPVRKLPGKPTNQELSLVVATLMILHVTTMGRILVQILLLYVVLYWSPLSAQDCTAQEKRSVNERVLSGCAHEIVEMSKAHTGTTIRGYVKREGDRPFEDVLVEVFPSNGKPDEEVYKLPSEERIVSATTDEKGRFSLHVKPGNYRLRFSYSGEWNCTYVKVAAGGLRIWTKHLEIPMSIGN
jgi:hypothetical protein